MKKQFIENKNQLNKITNLSYVQTNTSTKNSNNMYYMYDICM